MLTQNHITNKDVDYICEHDTGRLWILHGKPLPMQKSLSEVNYNKKTGTITLLGEDGQLCTMPVTVKAPLKEPFSKADKVTVLWTDKGDVLDVHILPLIAV